MFFVFVSASDFLFFLNYKIKSVRLSRCRIIGLTLFNLWGNFCLFLSPTLKEIDILAWQMQTNNNNLTLQFSTRNFSKIWIFFLLIFHLKKIIWVCFMLKYSVERGITLTHPLKLNGRSLSRQASHVRHCMLQ